MQVLCPLSQKAATSVCKSQLCRQNPFCCDSCSNQACVREHRHDNRTVSLEFTDIFMPMVNQLLQDEGHSQKDNEMFNVFSQQVEQLKQELDDTLNKFRKEVISRRKMVKLKPQVSDFLEKMRNHQSAQLTGLEVNKLLGCVESKNIYMQSSYTQEMIQTSKSLMQKLIKSLNDNIQQYGEEKLGFLKKSIVHGDTLRKQKKLAESIAEYSSILSADPKNADCLHRKASSYYLMNQFEEAIKYETEAIKLNEKDYIYYNNRGLNYYCLGNYTEALKDFTKAIEMSPNAKLFKNRGDCYRQSNQYAQALDDYQKALTMTTDNEALHATRNARAVCYYRMKKHTQAIEDLTEAINKAPNQPLYHRNRGDNLYELKMYNEAIEDYNKAIERNKEYAVAYNNRGNCHFCLKNYPKAIDDYSEAVRLDPKSEMYLLHRAKAYTKAGRLAEANADKEQADKIKHH